MFLLLMSVGDQCVDSCYGDEYGLDAYSWLGVASNIGLCTPFVFSKFSSFFSDSSDPSPKGDYHFTSRRISSVVFSNPFRVVFA